MCFVFVFLCEGRNVWLMFTVSMNVSNFVTATSTPSAANVLHLSRTYCSCVFVIPKGRAIVSSLSSNDKCCVYNVKHQANPTLCVLHRYKCIHAVVPGKSVPNESAL